MSTHYCKLVYHRVVKWRRRVATKVIDRHFVFVADAFRHSWNHRNRICNSKSLLPVWKCLCYCFFPDNGVNQCNWCSVGNIVCGNLFWLLLRENKMKEKPISTKSPISYLFGRHGYMDVSLCCIVSSMTDYTCMIQKCFHMLLEIRNIVIC